MSDPFFDADAHNPDHWRYWGRKRFDAAVEEVANEWRGTPMAEGKSNGDVHREAIRRLQEAAQPVPVARESDMRVNWYKDIRPIPHHENT